METLLQDIRFALRTLARRPAFTFIAILTLALGIGANTAIFSVVDSAPLPFRHVERLTIVWGSNPELAAKVGLPDKLPVSPGSFYDWKTARSFSKMAMVRGDRLSFTGGGEPELLGAVGVSGEFFQVLGVPALVGRTLLPEDDDKGKATTVVLSHVLWQRRFGLHVDPRPQVYVPQAQISSGGGIAGRCGSRRRSRPGLGRHPCDGEPPLRRTGDRSHDVRGRGDRAGRGLAGCGVRPGPAGHPG